MLEILQDIRARLRANEYKNEEHVRLSLVARIVAASGWNIWDPTEVYTEFKATEKEDNTRVDVALFAKNFEADTIFIECKGHGRIGDDLAKVERQLRDYNRNHSALFTIITDGQQWRFYYSLTSGEFAQKLFAKVDLVVDNRVQFKSSLGCF
ncbi:type I restriction enzyme HsdR N-terminal domain-containing protein [Hymenobacter algoricola]|uniref:Type I restriction enzyme R protein N-terminal domain-containing protein n=1 Tax=Hymenobacter algoricola TaxID=486267 RepID=A0ABP7MUA2_9BACT